MEKVIDIKEDLQNVHKLNVGELYSETLPGFMEIMAVPMNGKLAYNVGKNWKYLQQLQKEIHAKNMDELKKHTKLDEKGDVTFTEALPGQRPSPDYLSEESKKAYLDWYKTFSEEQEVELPYFPVSQEELGSLNSVKPATITSLSFMFR